MDAEEVERIIETERKRFREMDLPDSLEFSASIAKEKYRAFLLHECPYHLSPELSNRSKKFLVPDLSL